MRKQLGYINCAVHGRQRGYIVCRHISRYEDIGFVTPWTKQDGGDLLCRNIQPNDHTDEELYVACEASLRELGWLPAA